MLTDARFKFALESLKKCMLMEPKNNIFFSPALIFHNLLVMYFGATDDTENSLRKVLYIPDFVSKAIVQQYYYFGGVSQFCYTMNKGDNYTCRIFSRLLINESKELYVDTLNLFSSGHQVKEVNLDYRPDHIRNFINNCVKCNTQNYIQELLSSDHIDINTDAVLLNAIYCQGQLDHTLDDLIFDINNFGITKKGKSEQLNAYIIEVPCKERKISTFFIFPLYDSESMENDFLERDSIIKLIEQLTTQKGSQELQKLLDHGLTQQTDILFPIFDIEQDVDMYRLLDMLGLQEFTPPGTGQLHEFTCNSIRLGNVVHKVRLEMTSTSITAAAANVFLTNNSCQHVKTSTTVNIRNPCICLIYDRDHRNILFCGILLETI